MTIVCLRLTFSVCLNKVKENKNNRAINKIIFELPATNDYFKYRLIFVALKQETGISLNELDSVIDSFLGKALTDLRSSRWQ